ncbi:glycerate kinase type-2 family protein [Ruegeria sp. SCP11]|uniref:glycerate kinase type-2 family protein n=1 Tax=Ruegeria sp. SCP11 TaxID=3141378 RepID=UPI00333C8C9F
MDRKEQATRIWQAGVDAVGGHAATSKVLSAISAPDQILAVGKPAAAMARAALEHFGPRPTLVVTKDDHGRDLPEHVKVIEASHPVPDARSLQGGQALREAVEAMDPDSHLLLLVSGGASSLAEDLLPGKTLDDLEQLNKKLLSEGLDITAMNAERRKLSRIKGGGLLSHFNGDKATILAISDVPGDDLKVVGSGIGALPASVSFQANTQIVASNAHAREAAMEQARDEGFTVHANEECLHDNFLNVAKTLGERIRNMPTGVMVFGGEPTVVLPENPGRGGRNQALALALAQEIAGKQGITVVVGGTDGTDGPTQAAGAVVDGTTWGDGADLALQNADSGSYLERAGALLVTGPTGTNVMDLVVAIRA